MRTIVLHCLFVLAFVVLGISLGHEAPVMPRPLSEHKWLEKFIGEWTTDLKATMGPDQQ